MAANWIGQDSDNINLNTAVLVRTFSGQIDVQILNGDGSLESIFSARSDEVTNKAIRYFESLPDKWLNIATENFTGEFCNLDRVFRIFFDESERTATIQGENLVEIATVNDPAILRKLQELVR